jgi:hypothetical protein
VSTETILPPGQTSWEYGRAYDDLQSRPYRRTIYKRTRLSLPMPPNPALSTRVCPILILRPFYI